MVHLLVTAMLRSGVSSREVLDEVFDSRFGETMRQLELEQGRDYTWYDSRYDLIAEQWTIDENIKWHIKFFDRNKAMLFKLSYVDKEVQVL